jgi:endonuclease/exonuclease/phosphatase family metal-dependent hydrolase
MTTFRVASYNIRKCVGLDRRRDPDRILRVVADLGVDIVALQEADRRLPPRPSALPDDTAARLGMTALDVDPSTPSIGFHGNALLIGGGFLCTNLRGLDLPGLEPRGAIIADLARGEQKVRVVATHLGLLRRYRQMQFEAILRAVAEGPAMPVMIMGDFNEWSDTAGFEALEGWHVISPGLTYHAARPVAPLDRFVLSPGLRMLDAGVVAEGHALRASDHLPIVGRLGFGER